MTPPGPPRRVAVDEGGPGRGDGGTTVGGFNAAHAAAVYALLALAVTWPLVTALPRSMPWDMGDPVLNTWIMGWTSGHLLQLAAGHWHAWAEWWNPGVFYPAPLALAYSEHLAAQSILVLPLYAASGNPILCYNVSLLATFVLSALGAFLLARDLTGSTPAALVAGLLYGFAPYRIAQISHLQVLSSQWLPLAIYALRRHLATGTRVSLAGFVAAAVMQNLSCGYFLLYASPFIALWAAGELTVRGRWRDVALIARLVLAAGIVAFVTAPFVEPYYRLRLLGFLPRSIEEVRRFSADLTAYVTSSPALWLWGPLLGVFRKPENELFPGLVPLVLAGVAMGTMAKQAIARTRPDEVEGWQRAVRVVLAVVLVMLIAILAKGLVTGRLFWPGVTRPLRNLRFYQLLNVAIIAGALLLAVWARARAVAVHALCSTEAWLAVPCLAAMILSCGPRIESGGRVLVPVAPYAWLYWHVPGFDGLRVPARFATIVLLFLALLAALGVRVIVQRWRRPALTITLAALLFVAESTAAPWRLDHYDYMAEFEPPSGPLPLLSAPPPLYAYLASLPPRTALVELPFGAGAWDVRYMYLSLVHRHPLVNGYSGGFPFAYYGNAAAWRHPLDHRDEAWARLRANGVTQVVVHEAAFRDGEGPSITAWLVRQGALPVARFGTDVVLTLP